MGVLRRIRCSHCSSILLQRPIPASLRNFSSSATVALVARWRESAGLGWSGGRGLGRGRGTAVLVLSSWEAESKETGGIRSGRNSEESSDFLFRDVSSAETSVRFE